MVNAVVTANASSEGTAGAGALAALCARLGDAVLAAEVTAEGTPTLWVAPAQLLAALRELQRDFPMLLDVFGIDERVREHRSQYAADFTVSYPGVNARRIPL